MATTAEVEAVIRARDQASATLKKVSKETRSLSTSMKDAITNVTGLSPAMFGLAGAATAVVGGIVKATKDTIALGTQLVDLSSKTGLSIQSIQELKFAAEQAGVGFNVITDSVLRLGRRTAAELPEATKQLEKLGFSVDQILALSPEESFRLVAERLMEMGPGAEQAAAAMGIFGDAGLQVLPAINQGLEGNIDRFRELDAAMGDEAAVAAKELGDKITDLNAQWTGFKTVIGSAVIPALSNIMSFFQHILPGAIMTAKAAVIDFLAATVRDAAQAVAALSLVEPSLQGVSDKLFNMEIGLRQSAQAAQEAADKHFAGFAKQLTNVKTTVEQTPPPVVKLTGEIKNLNFELVESIAKTDEWAMTIPGLRKNIEMVDGATEGWSMTIPGMRTHIDEAAEAVDRIEEGTLRYNSALQAGRELMDLFGISADSTFGKILGWVDKLGGLFGGGGGGGIGGILGGLFGGGGGGGGGIGGILGGLFGGGGGGGGGIGGLLGGLFGGGGSVAGTVPNLGASVLGIGTAGGAGAGGLGGAIAGLLTNPITAVIGASLAGFFGIKALFGGESGQDQQQRVFGDRFGVDLGGGLGQSIADEQKRRSSAGLVGADQAQLLFLQEIFNTGTLAFDELARAMNEFVNTELGQTAEGLAAFSEITDEAIAGLGEMSSGGLRSVEQFLRDAETRGLDFEGEKELTRALFEELQSRLEAGEKVSQESLKFLQNMLKADGGGGGAKSVNTDVKIEVPVQAGVISSDPNDLASAIGDAVGLAIRDNLGNVVGNIERQLDGTFEKQTG